MKWIIAFLAAFSLLVPSMVGAQVNSAPPSCSVDQLAAGTCAVERLGARVRVRNNDAAVDENCASGTGAIAVICEYNGTNWETINLPGGDIYTTTTEAATFGAPNTMIADRTVLNQFIGIPKLNVTHTAALPDGTATAAIVTPLAASCAPITAGTEADDAVNFITGAASYQYTAAATAADNDGFDCDFTGHANVGSDSFGFWFMSDTALTAGTLDVSLMDGAVVEANADMPAITVVDEWQWIEVAFGTDCDATCADLDGVFIQVTAAGAATDEMDGTVLHIDTGGVWLSTGEVAIGNVLVGGVIDVSYALIAAAGVNTQTQAVEGTHYLVHYQTGADALIPLTDLQLYYATTLEALE